MFVNNILPTLENLSWMWNIPLQAQFYVTFPLLLMLLQPRSPRFRQRIALASAGFICWGMVYRIFVVVAFNVTPALDPFASGNAGKSGGHTDEDLRQVHFVIFWLWTALSARLVHLSLGVLVFLAASHTSTAQTLRSHSWSRCFGVGAVVLVSSALLFAAGESTLSPGSQEAASLTERMIPLVFLLGLISPMFVAATIAYVIVQPDWLACQLAALLGSKRWDMLADYSYAVFLVHMDVCFLVFKFIPVVQLAGSPGSTTILLMLPCSVFVLCLPIAVGVSRMWLSSLSAFSKRSCKMFVLSGKKSV